MDNTFIEIDVTDEIEPLLQRLAGNSKKSLKSAAKSLGYFMQGEIKQGVRSGAPGGEQFAERFPYKKRAKLQGGSAAKLWYGKMANAIGYQYDEGVLRIGWTSNTAAMYGKKQEEGYRTRITKAIRQKWHEADIKLSKNTAYLILPERPVFEPMSGKLQPQIAPYVQNKLNDYVEKDVVFSKKARRKYKVYG